ncbi:c-type cytochrome [Maribacter halichondriae]|uniref:c-type cytochrome n=1 Tax=Maribacter halichondriae TaxID=2980554 RepID=UPI002359FBB5|nr:cytochrome c [Maribacter sp. Hal144]
MMRRRSIYMLVAATALSSCEYNVENEGMVIDDSCEPTISYTATIQPLIANNCMPCHNGDGNIPDAPDLTTYAAVQSRAELVKEVTQSRRMPKDGTLTDTEIAAIKCWVDGGALDN